MEAAPPPTLARGLQAAAALVDRLKATLGDPKLLANLMQVLHRTVELQYNVEHSRDRLSRHRQRPFGCKSSTP